MSKILSKILKNNKLQVIGIFENSDDLNFVVLTLKKVKNKLLLLNKSSYSSYDTLEKDVNNGIATLLYYNGKKVFNKKVDISNDADLNWKKNIDLNQIYHTSYNTKKNNFISLCRRESIDFWHQKITASKIQIIDIYIGSFISSLLSKTIDSEILISDKLKLKFQDTELIDFNKFELEENINYSVGETQLSNVELPLYCAALSYFTENSYIEKSSFGNLNEEEIIYKRAFEVFGISILIFFFISLLISYFSIQYLLKKNTALNIENLYSNKTYQQILSLEEQIKEKEDIVNKSGFLSNHYLSFYSFEILNSIPNTIVLNELYINPLREEIKDGKTVEFTPYQIITKGMTNDENEFNIWIKKLKKQDWIKKFEIKSIKRDKKNSTLFEIIVTIN